MKTNYRNKSLYKVNVRELGKNLCKYPSALRVAGQNVVQAACSKAESPNPMGFSPLVQRHQFNLKTVLRSASYLCRSGYRK